MTHVPLDRSWRCWMFRALLISGGLFAACIWPTDEPYLASVEPPPLSLVDTAPGSGEDGVPTDSAVVFRYDAPVHPDGVSRKTVWLSAGSNEVASSRRVHLLDCTVTLRPHEPLAPLLLHRAETVDVFGFTAGPLLPADDGPLSIVFTTSDATAPDPAPLAPTLAEVHQQVLLTRCAGCHGGSVPPAGLDLSSEAAAAAGLISIESPLRSGSTRVVPGRHASSYLMWKLLNLPSVFGDPMPPTGDWPSDRHCGTTDADLRLIANWIDGL